MSAFTRLTQVSNVQTMYSAQSLKAELHRKYRRIYFSCVKSGTENLWGLGDVWNCKEM